jgi:propanol-preferring alcohol dehydrogenase
MIQVAAACGAKVAGLERSPEKLALIEELGAAPVDSTNLASVRLEDFDGRADAVIDLVGSPETLAWAWNALAIGGRLCVLTTFRDVDFRPEPRDFVFKESQVIGSRYASRAELMRAAELVASGAVRPVIGATADPREVEDLHEDLRAGRLRGRGALLWS